MLLRRPLDVSRKYIFKTSLDVFKTSYVPILDFVLSG